MNEPLEIEDDYQQSEWLTGDWRVAIVTEEHPLIS